MAYANFISPEYIFKHSPVDDNIDPDLVAPFIRMAQDLFLQEILGNTLYQKLINDVINNTLSGYYKTLMDDYIQPALVNWVVYETIPFINYKFTNKAISEKNTSGNTGGSNPTSLTVIKYLRDIVRDRAEYYNQRIRDYILNNIGNLPEYSTFTDIGIRPKQTSYTGGIYLGNTNDCIQGMGYGKPLN
jgi:hypothetical protein